MKNMAHPASDPQELWNVSKFTKPLSNLKTTAYNSIARRYYGWKNSFRKVNLQLIADNQVNFYRRQ